VSTNSNGKQVNVATLKAAISGNGSVVAFHNTAGLVAKDTNGRRDVYVKILSSGKTQLVSLTNGEKPGNLDSTLADVSKNGRWVVFTSIASNLVSGDTNLVADAFIRDRSGGTTVRVSRRGSTEANGPSYEAAISPDGAYVTFSTEATNLGGVETDENGTDLDMFEYEVATKTLRRVALDTTGGWPNGDSFDPTYGPSSVIAFTSWATDLALSDPDPEADVFTREFGENRDQPGTTTHRSVPAPTA
jgi:Tol biopolymer transport system component